MPSVTQRIKHISQPRGGYISPKTFTVKAMNDDGLRLGEEPENIHATLVGLAVDYLTRVLVFSEPLKAFRISIAGASLIGEKAKAEKAALSINELSPKTITLACQLSGYDVCFRAGPQHYKPINDILPDVNTVKNIEIMVNRSIAFFKEYGPVIKDGFTFEGGYSNSVNSGDGDFLTADTLWDFKVSKTEPKTEHTLQLLMYYIMGKHSIHEYFDGISRLGIFNPRLNKIYLKNISDIPADVIQTVEKEVLCYE